MTTVNSTIDWSTLTTHVQWSAALADLMTAAQQALAGGDATACAQVQAQLSAFIDQSPHDLAGDLVTQAGAMIRQLAAAVVAGATARLEARAAGVGAAASALAAAATGARQDAAAITPAQVNQLADALSEALTAAAALRQSLPTGGSGQLLVTQIAATISQLQTLLQTAQTAPSGVTS
jgi:hypothetical protein